MCRLAAAVLAGGLGTRLRSVVPDRPKVLASVGGRPFLEYLLHQLSRCGVQDVVLCTGYLGEQIKDRFGWGYQSLRLQYSQETSPLGTGGALRRAMPLFKANTAVLVMNGDSYCGADLGAFREIHRLRRADATLLLVEKADTGRYGRVRVAADGRIVKFEEKGCRTGPGLINAGVYVIEPHLLEEIPVGMPVSLEKDVFPSWVGRRFFGHQTPAAFLDIGVPWSYAKAESFFREAGLDG